MDYIQKIIVSGILYTENGVMLAKRPMTKKIAPGKYHLPGGHVEFGEVPEDALEREFQEEFSLPIKIEKAVRIFSYNRDDVHTIGITYLVTPFRNLPEKISFNKEDTEELVWVKDESELKNFFPEDDHDYKTLLEFFQNESFRKN